MRTDNVSDEIPLAAEVGVLGDKIAATGLAIALLDRWNVVAMQICSRGQSVLPAALCFLQVGM